MYEGAPGRLKTPGVLFVARLPEHPGRLEKAPEGAALPACTGAVGALRAYEKEPQASGFLNSRLGAGIAAAGPPADMRRHVLLGTSCSPPRAFVPGWNFPLKSAGEI